MIPILVRPEHTEEDRNGDYQLYGLTTKRFAKEYIFGIWGCLYIWYLGVHIWDFGVPMWYLGEFIQYSRICT